MDVSYTHMHTYTYTYTQRYMQIYIHVLADRITEYISSTQNNFYGFTVAQHFNPPSHCPLNDFYVTGIIHCNCSNVNQLNIENRIIS